MYKKEIYKEIVTVELSFILNRNYTTNKEKIQPITNIIMKTIYPLLAETARKKTKPQIFAKQIYDLYVSNYECDSKINKQRKNLNGINLFSISFMDNSFLDLSWINCFCINRYLCFI